VIRAFLFFLTAAWVFGEQSAKFTGGVQLTVSTSGYSAYSGDHVTWMRIHTIDGQPFTAPAVEATLLTEYPAVYHTADNRLRTQFWAESSCPGGSPSMTLNDRDDIWVIFTRNKTSKTIGLEAWNTSDGSGYVALEWSCGTFGNRNLNTIRLGSTANHLNVAVAELGQTLSVVNPQQGPGPRPISHSPDFLHLRLEGNGADSSPRKWSTSFTGTPSYMSTPVFPPSCSAGTSEIWRAGHPLALDATGSLGYDGQDLTYLWQIVSKPAKSAARLSSHTAAQPIVTGTAAGEHTFSLLVTQQDGRSSMCNITHQVVAQIQDGTPIYYTQQDAPRTRQAQTLKVTFSLPAGAASMRVIVRNPLGVDVDGSPFSCPRSPCSITVPDRDLGTHLWRKEYLSAEGAVRSASEWQPFPVTQGPPLPTPPVGKSPLFSHISVGTINYATPPSNILRWQAARNDWFISGPNPRVHNPTAQWITYKNNSDIYITESIDVREFADTYGYPHEEFYQHMDIDFNNNLPWKDMSQFGNWEKGTKGVFVGSLDKTAAAYDAAPGDVSINAPLYLAQGEPFDEIAFVLTRGRDGGSLVWEYSRGDGNWGALTLRSDETSGLRHSGKILFTPPSDWTRDTVGASRLKWWVRITITGATATPIADRIYSDNWLSRVAGMNSRGWASSNPGRILCCGGTYEYDPNPPQNATARFRHQARIRSFFGGASTRDNFMIKHLPVNGVYIWAHYMASVVVPQIEEKGYTGIMLDNGDTIHGQIKAPSDWRNHVDWVWPYRGEISKCVYDFVQRLKAALPGVLVGTNATGLEEAHVAAESPPKFPGDFILREIFEDTAAATFKWDRDATDWLTFDDMLPVNNPTGKTGLFHYFDSVNADIVTAAGDWYAFERANRRPILILATHYMGANENTVFLYGSSGYNSYSRTGEVDYYKEPGTTLAAELKINTTSATKTLTLMDASSFPSSGWLLLGQSELEGGLGEHIPYTSSSGNVITFTDGVYHTYPAGTQVRYVAVGQQGLNAIPLEQVYRWAKWFPAMGIDIGAPIGTRNLAWKTGAQYGDAGGTNIWRRDFEKAVVLVRPGYGGDSALRFKTPSNAITVDSGVTYYPLKADGTTGPGTQTIRLRQSEGAILMRSPLP
jgi:hypothetical protein